MNCDNSSRGACLVYLIRTPVFGRFWGVLPLYNFLSFFLGLVCERGLIANFSVLSEKNVELYTDKIFVELTAYRVAGLAIVTNGPN